MTPHALIKRYLREDLRRDAKVAAVILRACPDFVTDVRDERIDEFLSRIGAGTIRDETVLGWLERAGVNGARPVSTLKPWMRYALADQLEAFAKGRS